MAEYTSKGGGSGPASVRAPATVRGDARAHDRPSVAGSTSSPKRRSSSDAAATLAPLHLLAHNRRGSITDPSLHAASAAAAAIPVATGGHPSPRRSSSDSHQTRRLLDSPSVQRSPLPRHSDPSSLAGPSFMSSPRIRPDDTVTRGTYSRLLSFVNFFFLFYISHQQSRPCLPQETPSSSHLPLTNPNYRGRTSVVIRAKTRPRRVQHSSNHPFYPRLPREPREKCRSRMSPFPAPPVETLLTHNSSVLAAAA
jgi:hypothetical protein